MRHYNQPGRKFGRTKTKRGLQRTRLAAVTSLGRLSMGAIPCRPETLQQFMSGEPPQPFNAQETIALRERLESDTK